MREDLDHRDLDHRVHDAVALDEIDLYAEVLSAVAAADRPLTDEEIDAVLGLEQLRDAQPADRPGDLSAPPGPRSQSAPA
jgi:hypothetical protein